MPLPWELTTLCVKNLGVQLEFSLTHCSGLMPAGNSAQVLVGCRCEFLVGFLGFSLE